MDRRKFVSLSAGTIAAFGAMHTLAQSDATPQAAVCDVDALPLVEIEMTDDGFVLPERITAGPTRISIVNTGTKGDSHLFIARVAAEDITDERLHQIVLPEDDGSIDYITDLVYVGAPDWPMPGGPAVEGIVNLEPGRNMIANIADTDSRGVIVFDVEDSNPEGCEPTSDITVQLMDYHIMVPQNEMKAGRARWRLENIGAVPHDISLLAVPDDFTVEDLAALFEAAMNGTPPPPDVPMIEFLPSVAIGVLAPGGTSWLEVDLKPGRLIGVCMLPFGLGYPHAIEGMVTTIDVK